MSTGKSKTGRRFMLVWLLIHAERDQFQTSIQWWLGRREKQWPWKFVMTYNVRKVNQGLASLTDAGKGMEFYHADPQAPSSSMSTSQLNYACLLLERDPQR